MNRADLSPRRLLRVMGAIVVVCVVAVFVVFAVPQTVGADHSYVVLSSSMAPAMDAGDAVFVEEVSPERIAQGDVITFEPPADHGEYGTDRVTHRVVEIVERDDGPYFRTQGDANEEPDQALVPADNVVGRVSIHVPELGHAVLFAGSKAGIVTLVVLPAVLLGLDELYKLWTVTGASSPENSDNPPDTEPMEE